MYIPFLIFLVLALLAAAGAVIDMGTVARNSVQIQRAADAGVLAGLAYRTENRKEQKPKAAAELRAKLFVRQNLIQLGHDPDRAQIEADFKLNDAESENQESLTVTVKYDASLLLLSAIPLPMLGAGEEPGSMEVFGSAKGTIPPSNIVLVLDTSNSMACPGAGACPCQQAGVVCNLTPGSGAKIFELRTGVYKFLENFRENYDRIALVSFDVVADTIVSFNPNGFQLEQFEQALGREGESLPEDFSPGGMTNPSDGLSEAYQELKRNNFIEPTGRAQEPVAVVFFTDGAPTAADVCFSDTLPALPVSDAQTSDPGAPALCPPGSKRYTQFEVEWVTAEDGIEQRFRGPSPLLKREHLLNLPKVARVPEGILVDSDGEPNTNAFPECSKLKEVDSPTTLTQSIDAALRDCVKSLAYALPDTSIENNGQPFEEFKQLYYHRAVSIADYLRRNNFLLYAIGLGGEAPVPANTDIYEDHREDFVRKDGFLLSMTNHTDLAQSELYNPDTGEYAEFPYQGFAPWEDRIEDKRSGVTRDGYYLQSADPGRISDMFSEVARRIQLRLVN